MTSQPWSITLSMCFMNDPIGNKYPANYARYRLRLNPDGDAESLNKVQNYPCFRVQLSNDTELLWGATYRIVTIFLDYIFGFKPPDFREIPIIEGSLDQNYLTGHN